MNMIPNTKLFASAFLLFVFGLALVIPVVPSASSRNTTSLLHAALEDSSSAPTRSAVPVLLAQGAMVFDPLHNAVLFQKNADTPHGIASITKIMTAFAALDRLGEGEIITISADAVGTEGAEGGLLVGERFTLKNLAAIMLTASSNDAAAAIAEHVGRLYGATYFPESQQVFVRMMNEQARAMGLTRTIFRNPTGLDLDEKAGILSNTSTAWDMAILITRTLRDTALWDLHRAATTIVSENGVPHHLVSTHELFGSLPGIWNGKTGFTDTAGGALATIVEAPVGKLSIIVVLGSTRDGRFEDTKALLDWLRN